MRLAILDRNLVGLLLYAVDAEGKPERLSSVYTARMPEEKSVEFKTDFEPMVTTIESKLSHDDRTPEIRQLFL